MFRDILFLGTKSLMEYLSNWTDPMTQFGSGSQNSTDQPEDEEFSPLNNFLRRVQVCLVPVLFVFGLVGNLLAAGCFLSEPLRSTSCCLYMAGKCASDTGFLVPLFMMWLLRVGVDVVNVVGACQLTVFLSYVCGFMSVWFVVPITFENYIRLCRPQSTRSYCTTRVAVAVIAAVVLAALVGYSFPLWTTGVLHGREDEEPACMSLLKFKDVLIVMTFVDTVITLLLPSFIIIPLVMASLFATLQAMKRKQRIRESLIIQNQRHVLKNSLELQVAKFLLTVSMTFVILHSPGHLLRLKMLVDEYLLHKASESRDIMLQRLFECIYYFNFCGNLVIFLSSGANFRSRFSSMYCQRSRCVSRSYSDEYSLSQGRSRNVSENHCFNSDNPLERL